MDRFHKTTATRHQDARDKLFYGSKRTTLCDERGGAEGLILNDFAKIVIIYLLLREKCRAALGKHRGVTSS